ncbi:MAG TPA: formate--tetrahydrofolate ligase, partial [Chitinivibrionales bacterium]|nr:formate--tetrahydrofolate ligase [Chitinivibrionales bacterium]
MPDPKNRSNGLAPRRVVEVAEELGLDSDKLLLHGHYIAKVPLAEYESRKKRPDGSLILVSAMTPTPQGEGKTTTTVGLGDALRQLGKKSSICVREPSLGPYFGIKGGGTGAGRSQVVPAEAVNLHFTGDMYSVTKANNLLAAMVDNHLQHGNELNIDPRRVVLRRVIDLNDRALREIVVGLGGVKNGIPRKDGFNITPASEVMAILCLCRDFFNLGDMCGRMVVAYTYKGERVFASDIQAVGAMQVLLRDAIDPNLVQTMEGTPAFVHGGPFANIAQGTNTAIATRMALKLTDYVVTEAGFGTDLGAEKFFHIKCRLSGLNPSAAVIVATTRAVEYHGGYSADAGLGNLCKHIENIRLFGLQPVVAINQFEGDKPKDLDKIIKFCEQQGVEAAMATHFRDGGKGATALAEAVLRSIDKNGKKKLACLYPLSMPLAEKIETVAKLVYGAGGVTFDHGTKAELELAAKHGYGNLPVCIAKTPLSLSDNASLRGLPKNFRITVNEIRV